MIIVTKKITKLNNLTATAVIWNHFELFFDFLVDQVLYNTKYTKANLALWLEAFNMIAIIR